jgi:AraC-like DNA-binding protein
MARPKPFSYEQFEERLNRVIDLLIEEKKCLPEEEVTDISVKEITQAFKVNVATLRRWCMEHVKRSPSRYLAEYRIEKAKHMLRQGIKPSVVSNMLAFTEHKTFCEVFKRCENMSPLQYK